MTMIVNGYDTTTGSRYKVGDKVSETVRQLQSTDRLELVDSRGVYSINHRNDFGLPPFIFPMSIQNYLRETVTVIDVRPFINRDGRNINIPDYNIMMLAASLQQDLAKGNKTLIKSVRPFTIKAFANSLGRKLERLVKLDMTQMQLLRCILAYYYVCLLEDPTTDYPFIAQNSIRNALGYDVPYIQDVIEDLGYVGSLVDLHRVITTHPALYSLSRLDLAGLVQAGSTIFFNTSGYRMVMGAALEMPTLFTALCWGSATQRIYQNTMVGEELNVKKDKKVEAFINTVNYHFKTGQ